MIRVHRSPEPQALTNARARGISGARLAFDTHGASAELSAALHGYGAESVKKTLFADQHKKCAWCERRRDFSSSPVTSSSHNS